MVKVFSKTVSEMLWSMFQVVRASVYDGQIAYYPDVAPLSPQDTERLIDEVVEAYAKRNCVQWKEVLWYFEDIADVRDHLSQLLILEWDQADRPVPDKGCAEVCYGIAVGGRREVIGLNTGFTADVIDSIATQHADFISTLKAAIQQPGFRYSTLTERWEAYYANMSEPASD